MFKSTLGIEQCKWNSGEDFLRVRTTAEKAQRLLGVGFHLYTHVSAPTRLFRYFFFLHDHDLFSCVLKAHPGLSSHTLCLKKWLRTSTSLEASTISPVCPHNTSEKAKQAVNNEYLGLPCPTAGVQKMMARRSHVSRQSGGVDPNVIKRVFNISSAVGKSSSNSQV